MTTTESDGNSTVAFFSAILRIDAVDRKVPGGRAAFLADAGGIESSGLIVASAMNMADINDWIDRVESRFDLLVGEDLALGEQFHGEIEPCPGVIFVPPKGSLGRWSVKYEDPNHPSESCVVFSSFCCVESGEVPHDGEPIRFFGSASGVFAFAREMETRLLRHARREATRARTLDGAYAPYIVRVTAIRLGRHVDSEVAALDHVRALFDSEDDEFLSRNVVRHRGVVLGEFQEEGYSVADTLADLRDWLS